MLRDNADFYVMAVSPVNCAVTALAYNRSLAFYDRSTRQCFLHDQNEMTGERCVLYVHGNTKDIKTCGDLEPGSNSGVYRISPVPVNSFDVYCDMDSDGGPWTVIQNRQSNDVDFYRNWDQYKHGFGDLLGNFWLGNEHLHKLTETPCFLRVQLESLNGTFGFAEYSTFQVSSEDTGYQLLAEGYNGNIGNGFQKSNGQLFTTPDVDNDKAAGYNCAEERSGAWWHQECTRANLNGLYDSPDIHHAMYWRDFFGAKTKDQLKRSRLLLKKT